MILSVQPISDSTIVSMLAENDPSAWERLYDKYAPMMYGMVLKVAKDEEAAKKIFKECFLHLKETKNMAEMPGDLCPFLLKYVNNFTSNYFKLLRLTAGNEKINNDPLINMFFTNKRGSKMNIEQQEMRKKLREEFNLLRNKNKRKGIIKNALTEKANF